MLFGNLSEIVPAVPVPACATDGFDLQNVVRMKMKISPIASGKGVEYSLSVMQENGSRNEGGFAGYSSLGQDQP